MEQVAAGICTFRRPVGIERALHGLSAQTFSRLPKPDLQIVVVDNDDQPGTKAIVMAFNQKPWPVLYRQEPRRGLVHSRNRLLESVPKTSRWLAMLDDDEIPATNWLEELILTAQRYHAPIIAGPVEPEFRQPPASWIQDGGFFRRPAEPDGTPTRWISTNNVLVDLQIVRKEGWLFDPAFNLSGGEDEDFFSRALAAGYRAVTSQNALVVDDIPPDRAGLRFLLMRHFRMGTTLAQIDRKNGGLCRGVSLRLAKSFVRLFAGIGKACLLPIKGRPCAAQGLLDMARALGGIIGLWGFRPRLYGASGSR